MSLVAKASSLLQPRVTNVKVGPIGIDFALESIHLVQLESAYGELPDVRARASVRFDAPRREILGDPNRFRTVIKRGLELDRFHGRKAVVAVPSGMFRTVSINYKSGSDKEQQAAAILDVMQGRLEGALHDYVLDYLPVKNRSKNDEHLALVAVSERQPIVDLLETTRKAGLDVQALEIGPVAISRLVGAISTEHGSDNVLVINSGRRASYLTLISGADLLFDQEVGFGENSLIHQVATTLDMSESMARELVLRTGVQVQPRIDTMHDNAIEDTDLASSLCEILKPQFLKLVEEIKRVCLYAAAETRGGAVNQIFLLGSIARWPGTEHLLTSMAGVRVAKVPDPLALFPGDLTRQSSPNSTVAPEIAVASGLALRGMRNDG